MTKGFGRLKNIANIGDIVVVAGYIGREFRVDSYTHEIDYQPTYTAEVILYDVSDVITGEYLLAYQEDVSVIRRAGNVSNPKPPNASSLDMDFGWTGWTAQGWEWVGEMSFNREEETTVRSRRLTKEEQVDELLTEISDYRELVRMFGDDNNEYKTKIDYAKMKLAELTGGK